MLSYLKDVADMLHELSQRERLEVVMEMGEALKPLPKEYFVDDNKVPGCVSNVFVLVEKDAEGKVHFQGHADALTVKGYLTILLTALEELTPEEILASDSAVEQFVERAQVKASLVPSRANAFGNIFQFIKNKVR